VVSGKLAYSRGEATSKGIDWLSTISPLHADTIRLELQKMKSEGYVPAALKGIVKPEEAISRYDASIKWITEHRNAVISNGPFYLDDFNAEAQTATIKAFRDESYPFEQGHWSSFGNPMIASINKIDTGGSIVIGQPKPIQVYISIAGQPNSDAQVEYFISGREGTILKGQGEPVSNEPGKFEINLQAEETSKLSAGPATFKVFVTGNKAYRPDFRVLTVLISTGAGVTNGGAGSSTPTQPDNQPPPSGTNNQPSGCLIATAAFGSELTPQVQYLRNFRDNYILSTASGSAFMNIFNSVYYSFSPQVADYERENPWLQKTVKISLYPLFGILMLSERAHSSVGGGEAGAVLAGTTVSVLIGAVYLSLPAAALNFVKGGNRKFSLNFKGITIVLVVLGGLTAAIAIGAVAGNTSLLSVTSATFVLVTTGISALAAGKAFFKCFANMRTKRQDF
jgi:peptide/nickel transport system substrate-binding protein